MNFGWHVARYKQMKYADLIAALKGRLMNVHRPSGERPIFLFSAPRSGSTYLLELLSLESGMKVYDEPESIHNISAQKELGVNNWRDATVLENREIVYSNFFTKLMRNEIPELNTPLYRRTGRLFTNRIAFKVLHAGEDIVPWFEETFKAYIVVLVRHPIPTSLSHKQFPRLPYLIQQDSIRRRLQQRQLRTSERIINSGSHFEKGILNWCLQYMFMLGLDRDPNWTIITYEDLVTRPRDSIKCLAQKLNLACVDRILAGQNRPSRSSSQSDAATHKMLANLDHANFADRELLIKRWKTQVDDSTERLAFELLHLFDIDYYTYGNLLPSEFNRIPEQGAENDGTRVALETNLKQS
jgi:hypothetical protein